MVRRGPREPGFPAQQSNILPTELTLSHEISLISAGADKLTECGKLQYALFTNLFIAEIQLQENFPTTVIKKNFKLMCCQLNSVSKRRLWEVTSSATQGQIVGARGR